MKYLMNRTAIFVALLLVACVGVSTVLAADEGRAPSADKVFPAVQAAYVHPRVFATSAELPAIEARLTSAGFGANIGAWLKARVTNQLSTSRVVGGLAAMTLDPDNITDQQLDDGFFAYGEFDSQDMAVMALWGVLFTSDEASYVATAKETALAAVVNFSVLADNVHQRYVDDDYSGLDADTEAAIKAHWSKQADYSFKLGHIRQNGGVGLALAYDMLYNDMTTAQRDTVRNALALATNGWNVHGGDDTSALGMDGNAVSNHYGYQGEQLVILAAYYGETGWEQSEWDTLVKVIKDYLIVGFNPSGYPIEDSYGPDLGLREGSRALIAMAYAGDNMFVDRRDALYNIGFALAHDIETVDNGSFIGGESGGNYAFGPSSPSGENPNPTYPTFHIVWKHVFPDDAAIDYLYHWRVGDNYQRTVKSQSTIDYAFFGSDYDQNRAATGLNGLNLTQYFPRRGKVVSRENQLVDGTQFAFDARPDAFIIGHDKSGRGHFSLNGVGRQWVIHLNFRDVRYSDESSTMHIDGVGQAYKAPSVKMVDAPVDDGLVMRAAADLKYAYDWQWNQPWTFSSTANPQPDSSDPNWERETIDPSSFYPAGEVPDWLGDSLDDDVNMGYKGMWMWRRPNLPVQKAYRSVAYVRTEYPFVIIADDIRQDDASHLYESLLQLPFDVNQTAVNGNDVILKRPGESQQLLVRVLQAEATSGGVSFNNQAYTTSLTGMSARRFRIGVTAVEPKLKILLWPHETGMALPTTTWGADKSWLTVSGEGIEPVTLSMDDSAGYTRMAQSVPTSVELKEGGVSAETPHTLNLLILLLVSMTVAMLTPRIVWRS